MSGATDVGYRHRLKALEVAGTIESHLDAWAAERGWTTPLGWRREYGRLQPGRSPWAVLAYSGDRGQAAVRVDLIEERLVAVESTRPTEDEPSGLTITDCPDDQALPGLRTVLTALADPAIVRYRPGNRCTVRGGSGEDERFVKVTSHAPEPQIDAQALWAASCAGAFSFAVAQPRGWDLRTQSSWYGVVPGEPITASLLGPDGPAVARRIGTALAELARSPVSPTAAIGPPEQLARSGRMVRRTVAVAPVLEPDLEAALEMLARLHGDFSARPPVPVHGSPHMHQWLEDATGRLGLVDFDRFALGEPELDLATFLVELESESERVASMIDLELALIEGFDAVDGLLDPTRLATYTAHKRLAKVARTACGLRPDGVDRAARHLAVLTEDLVNLNPTAARPPTR